MLSGKDLIMATKPFAKEVQWKSWLYTLSTLFILLGLIATIVFLDIFYLRLAASTFLGLVIVRLFVIYHDFEHHAILNKSVPAKIIFTVFGILVLAPSSIWKRSHDYHHKHNSKLFSASIGSYPIFTKEKYLASSKGIRFLYLFTRHPLTIFFGYISMFLYGMCIQSFLSSPRRHWDSLIAIAVHAALSALIIYYTGIISWLLFFILPYFIACMIGAYLFYAQHNFPGVTFSENQDWSYTGAAIESSSYMKMNFFWRWVTANIGYHHIHHVNARIPFYRLPEAMKEIKEFQNAKITSLNPSDIYSCFRLKIWDQQKRKMIGLKEL